jgi:hypothetical protein
MATDGHTADIQLAVSPLTACANTAFNVTVESPELGPFTVWALDPTRLPPDWLAGWATQSDARQYPFTSITNDEDRIGSGRTITWTPQPALSPGAQYTFAVFGGNGVGLLGGSPASSTWLQTVSPCLPNPTPSATPSAPLATA